MQLGDESAGAELAQYVARTESDAATQKSVARAASVDWNSQYQDALELEEGAAKFALLTKLSTDFVQIAAEYGRTIISELCVPDSQKTILPKGLGGVAGGHKFIVNGIFFKLARDTIGIYGGQAGPSLELASKAAGHELKGANCYFGAQQYVLASGRPDADALRVPMQALVDYRGFRLVAMPVLPLERHVYGSKDGGKNVLAEDPSFSHQMALLAETLHLRAHRFPCPSSDLAAAAEVIDPGDYAGVNDLYSDQTQTSGYATGFGTGKSSMYRYTASIVEKQPQMKRSAPPMRSLHSAGDVEGHLGSDGRRYLLDLSRAFPPESPAACPHLPQHPQSVFFRLLRPEFLQYLKQSGRSPPLNPDALSCWGRFDPDFAQHNRDVYDASCVLVKEVIPSLVQRWNTSRRSPCALSDLSTELHRSGINMRHLGLLRSLALQMERDAIAASSSASNSGSQESVGETWSQSLLVEMVARTCKNLLRRWLRAESQQGQASEYSMKTTVVHILNLISGAYSQSDEWWAQQVLRGIRQRFGDVAIEDLLQGMPESDRENAPASAGRHLRVNVDMHGRAQADSQPSREGGLLYVLRYILRMTGFQLTPACATECLASRVCGFEFSPADVEDGALRIKHMTVIDLAQGDLLLSQSSTSQTRQEAKDPRAVARLLALGARTFGNAVQTDPTNVQAIRQAALCRVRQHVVGGEPARADSALLEGLEQLLELPPSIHLLTQGAHPLLDSMFVLWRGRRSATSATATGGNDAGLLRQATIHRGGATSIQALLRTQSLLAQLRAMAESPRVLTAAATDRERELLRCFAIDGLFSRELDTAWQIRYALALAFRATIASTSDALLRAYSRLPLEVLVSGSMAAQLSAEVWRPENASSLAALWRILLEAVTRGQPGIIGFLQEVGVSVNGHDRDGETPLIRACAIGDAPLARALLAMGASTESAGLHNETALFRAVAGPPRVVGDAHEGGDGDEQGSRSEVLKLLVQAGAAVEARNNQGRTPLLVAAACGNVNACRVLLTSGADPSARDSEGRGVLHLSTRHPRVLELLLSTGDGSLLQLVSVRDRLSLTPLLLAAQCGHIEGVRALLGAGQHQQAGWQRTSDGHTALHLSVQCNHPEVTALLLQAPTLGDELFPATDRGGRTALMLGAASGARESVEVLLSWAKSKDPALLQSAVSATDRRGMTALMYAAASPRSTETQRILIEAGSPLNARDHAGRTAVFHAALQGRSASDAGECRNLKMLLEHGADIESADVEGRTVSLLVAEAGSSAAFLVLSEAAGFKADICDGEGSTVVMKAAVRGDPQMMGAILHCPAVSKLLPQLLEVRDRTGMTPLMNASYFGHAEVVLLLLEARADPLAVHRLGKTALIYASWRGCARVAEILLEAKADPEVREHDGRTALTYAAWEGHANVVEVLLHHRALVNAANNRQKTSLHYAVQRNRVECARLLVAAGADPDIQDADGSSPLDYARHAKRTTMERVLLEGSSSQASATDNSHAREHRRSDAEAGSVAGLEYSRQLSANDSSSNMLLDGSFVLAVYHGLMEVVSAYLEHSGGDDVGSGELDVLYSSAVFSSFDRRDGAGSTQSTLTQEQSGVGAVWTETDFELAIVKDGASIDPALPAWVQPDGSTVRQEMAQLQQHLAQTYGDVVRRASREIDSKTALMIAAERGHCAVAEVLLAHGANPNVRTRLGLTALHFAAMEGHAAMVRMLLLRSSSGATSMANAANKWGWSPLMYAAGEGHLDVMQALLEHGADVNHFDTDRMTALHVAAVRGHTNAVRLLLDAGSNVCAGPDEQGRGFTALLVACRDGREPVVRLLLGRCRSNSQQRRFLLSANSDGLTPLMQASEGHHVSTIRCLLEAASEEIARVPLVDALHVESKDADGRTALKLAAALRDSHGIKGAHELSDRQRETVQLLVKEMGADVSVLSAEERAVFAV